MVKYNLTWWCLAMIASLAMVACSEDQEDPYFNSGQGRAVRACLAPFMVDGESSELPSEDEVRDMRAYLFEDGVLSEVYENIVEKNGIYTLPVDYLRGHLYFVANGGLGTPAIGELDEASWLESTAGMDNGETVRFLAGQLDLEAYTGATEIPLTLKRGVARVDLHIDSAGIKVHQLKLRNVADQGFVFPGDEVSTPPSAEKVDLDAGFTEPVIQTTRGIFYIYEQRNDHLTVELSVSVGDQVEPKTLTAALPSTVRRNAVYVLNVHPDGNGMGLKADVEEWDYAEDLILSPDIASKLIIDASRSDIPEGVTLGEKGDQLSISHFATAFTITVDCDNVLELVGLEQLPAGFTIRSQSSGVAGENSFRIEKKLMPVGAEAESFDIHFKRKGLNEVYPEDVIHVVMEKNPSLLEGDIQFDIEDYTYRFEDYADGDFGIFEVPEGREVIVEVDSGEDQWMIAKNDNDDNRFRIVGGWKPNDPKADGREQSARIVIRDIGTEVNPREEYTVIRKNYGLPVTLMNGIWWCKYNSRGNSKDFADQILVPNDPAVAAGKTLLQYLNECSVADYLALWGWSYQGGNTQGLRVADINGVVSHVGYNSAETVHTNKLDPKALAPTGYEMPKIEYYNRIFQEWWMYVDRDGGPYNVYSPWEGNRQVFVAAGNRTDLQIGTVTLQTISHFEVYDKINGIKRESVTFYGPGAQWGSGGVNVDKFLFACYSPSGSGWYNGSYGMQFNGGGPKDTRIVRFIKSPVEYIYGWEGE